MPTKLFFDDTNADFEYSTTLSGQEYILRFIYNSVSGTWQMDVKDYLGVNILSGVRLVSFYPLTTIYKAFSLPDGVLAVVQRSEGPLQTPSRYSFSQGVHELWYYTREELDEINSQV